MKDLIIVYLLLIRIIMSFICPCNHFALRKLTSTFFGVYTPGMVWCPQLPRPLVLYVWGCSTCPLSRTKQQLCHTARVYNYKGQKRFLDSLYYIVSSSSLVSSHQMFTCLRLTCGEELQHIIISTNSNFLHVTTIYSLYVMYI